MTITVVIPTYRRPKDLARYLEALRKQTRLADEVLVVVRDTETWTFLEAFNSDPLPSHTVTVKVQGLVAAMNAGLDVAQGDIIAFTDDDAAPHTDWLTRIKTHFSSDRHVGAVGGRDWAYYHASLLDGASNAVGWVQYVGRLIGNHHIGVGESREVDVLKGANMSFRRTAITGLRFDERMQGAGAQVHFELSFCSTLRRAGWKLIYDPLVAVDHYPAQRFDKDQRNQFNEIALINSVHNEILALLEHLPSVRQVAFLVWAILVGTRDAPGFVQWLRLLPSEGKLAGQKWLASLHGRQQGWQTWQQGTRSRKSFLRDSIGESHCALDSLSTQYSHDGDAE